MLKKKILGIPLALMLIGLLVVGGATAALLSVYVTVSGENQVDQSVVFGDDSTDKQFSFVGENVLGGKFIDVFTLKNRANAPAGVKFDTEQKADTKGGAAWEETGNVDGVTTTYYDLSDHVLEPVTTGHYVEDGTEKTFDITETKGTENQYFGWDALEITKKHRQNCDLEFQIDAPRVLENLGGNQDNFALMFDVNNDGDPDWQVGYDGNPDSHAPTGDHWFYKDGNVEDGWNGWGSTKELPEWVTVSTNDQEVFNIRIDSDKLGNQNGMVDDCGASYRFALMVILSDEGYPEGWQGEGTTVWYPEEVNNVWTSSSDYEEESLGSEITGPFTLGPKSQFRFAAVNTFDVALKPGNYKVETKVEPTN